MKLKLFVAVTILFLCVSATFSKAQTASSLFRLTDSLQVNEITSQTPDMSEQLGHMGPAVENSHMAMRLYFNDSGAIDLYSKTARGMELLQYKWYPAEKDRQDNGAGHDSYNVGNTLGFGGIALWDGEKMVRLAATKGRTARVGDSPKASFAEIISYGVVCGADTLDILVRIDMSAKKRQARVTAKELNGKKVCFVTGLNYWDGQKVVVSEGYTYVWGVHKDEAVKIPIGAGMQFNNKKFQKVEKVEGMVRLISSPSSSISTTLIGASTLEAELNSLKRFEAYMSK